MSDLDDLKAFANAPSAGPTLSVAAAQPSAPQPAPDDLSALKQFVAPEMREQQYGSLPQQALAGLEGVARGATLGTSDVLETGLGLSTPEAIRTRMAVNPGTSVGGSLLGGAGLLAATGGISAPAEAGTLGALAASSAEGALFGAGNVITDKALGDPDLNSQKILANIGLGAGLGLLGGVAGQGLKSLIGKTGYLKGSVSDAVEGEAAGAEQQAQTMKALDKEQMTAQKLSDFRQATKELNAPDHPAMLTDNSYVQQATDSLMQGSPTFAGQLIRNVYNEGYQTVKGVLQRVFDVPDLSANEFGKAAQDSLSNKIGSEAEPFQELYGAIKEDTQEVPLKDKSSSSIARNITKIAEDPAIGKHSPASKLALEIADEIPDLKTVDQLRDYQTNLNTRISGANLSLNEKRILGLVREKLDNWEQSAIKNYAGDFISKVDQSNPEEMSVWGDKVNRFKTLLSRIDEADAQYAPFRQKIGQLSEWLGKGKVSGARDAIDFIQNRLEPEDLARKLSDRKYAGLQNFMDKNFPEESALMKQYQKKLILNKVSTDGNLENLDPKKVIREINDLGKKHPELVESTFSPDELKKLDAAKTYLGRFPRDFNPSHTSHAGAFRRFFSSPVGAAAENTTDAAMLGFIHAMAALPDGVRPLPSEVAGTIQPIARQINAAQGIIDKTNSQIGQNIQYVFGGAKGAAVSHLNDVTGNYDDKVKRIEELAKNPDVMSSHLQNHIDGISQHLPAISQGISGHLTNQVQFLNSKIPRAKVQLPLSPKWTPSNDQKQKFNRYYKTVDNPIGVIKDIKSGTISSDQMEALQTCHPQLLQEIQNKLSTAVSPDKVRLMPYTQKQSLARFLGQPLDESMLQPVLTSNQAAFMALNQAKAGQQNALAGKSTLGGMNRLKLSERESQKAGNLEET